jgi:serine/threonine protein kinase
LTKTSGTATEPVRRLGVGAAVVGERGSYRITEIFKAGGMGETYLAAEERTGRLAVIKVIQARLLQAVKGSAAERIVKRFDREIDILRLLRGLPHVVNMLDAGEIKDATGGAARFMVLEFIEGKELRRHLPDRAPLDVRAFVNLGLQLCQGLVSIHERGQSHRDIKPENVMVEGRADRSLVVKYIDFGLGKPVFGGLEQVTHLNDRIGTNDYVAPELSLRMGDIREDEIRQADVYSLGVLLWRMATGGPPFGPDATPELRRNPPEPTAGLAARFTPALKDALRRSVLPRPLDRPTSKQLRDAFAAYAADALRDAGRASDPPKSSTPVPATEMEATEISVHELGEGRVLAGRYRIDGKLGEGSMGSVYRATDQRLKRVVAVKVAHDRRALVTDEAENLAKVEHQNIVRVIDIGEDQGSAFIVMEYVGGETLSELLADGRPISGDLLRDLALGIVDGVRFAHGKGVQHNDLGPNNVKWDGEKRAARILDFGIAEGGADAGKKGVKATNLAVLTPDQLLGVEGEASDLYQIGVLLYLLTTGKEPYTADTVEEYKRLVLEHLPPAPRVVNPTLDPPELSDLVMKCLAKKAEDRFASAEELHEALAEVFRPKAKTSKAMAVAASVLAAALLTLLALRVFGVGPFKPAPPEPRVEFLKGLASAGPFRASLTAAAAATDGGPPLLTTTASRLSFAIAADGGGAAWWDGATKDLPAAEFAALVAVVRRGPDGVARELEAVRKADGIEVEAPPVDGAYEDAMFVRPKGGDAAAETPLGAVRYVRDTRPPRARLATADGAPIRALWQFPAGKTDVRIEALVQDDGGLAGAPRFVADPAESARFSDVAANEDGALSAVMSGPTRATTLAVAAADRVGRAAEPAAEGPARSVVLPAQVVKKVKLSVGATRRELDAAAAAEVAVDASGADEASPRLVVELVPAALPAGATLRLRVRGAEGGPDAVVRAEPDGSFVLVSDWKDRRLVCAFSVETADQQSTELQDVVAAFRCSTQRAAVSRTLRRAAERGDAAELSARALDDDAIFVLAPGDALFVAAPPGGRLELLADDGKSPAVADDALGIRVAADGAELSAKAEVSASAPWLRSFRLRLTTATSDVPDVRPFRVALAPFGVSAKVADTATVGGDGTVWIGKAWPLLPVETAGEAEGAFRDAGFALVLSGADKVAAGWQAQAANEARATVRPEVRRGGFRFPLPIAVGGGLRNEALLRRDDAAPRVAVTWAGKSAEQTLLPFDRASDFRVEIVLDDGSDGIGAEPELKLTEGGGRVVRGEPVPNGGGKIRFGLAAQDLRVGVDYVFRDRLGNEDRLRFAEEPRPVVVSGGDSAPAPPPPPILTRAIVDARAAKVGITLLPIGGGGSLRMMEFELTQRNALRLQQALAQNDPSFAGVPAEVRATVARLNVPGDSSLPQSVFDASLAQALAEALGLELPTVAEWLLAARGSSEGSDNPKRADGKFFNRRTANGANLSSQGGEKAESAEWFTVAGLNGLKAMAGNMAELVRTAGGTAWIGGDWVTPEPKMSAGNASDLRARGVRFATKLP